MVYQCFSTLIKRGFINLDQVSVLNGPIYLTKPKTITFSVQTKTHTVRSHLIRLAWQRELCKAQLKGEEERTGRRNDGKTTLKTGPVCTSQAHKGQLMADRNYLKVIRDDQTTDKNEELK